MKVFTDRARLLGMAFYPGMDEIESRVLRAFIRGRGAAYQEWRFVVRVGEGEAAPEGTDPTVARSVNALTKARLDCVAFNPPRAATLIEVKRAWDNAAVWQLLGYRELYRLAFPDHDCTLVGVAEWATTTSKQLAAALGVHLSLWEFENDLPDVTAPATEEGSHGV